MIKIFLINKKLKNKFIPFYGPRPRGQKKHTRSCVFFFKIFLGVFKND